MPRLVWDGAARLFAYVGHALLFKMARRGPAQHKNSALSDATADVWDSDEKQRTPKEQEQPTTSSQSLFSPVPNQQAVYSSWGRMEGSRQEHV